MGQRTVPVTLDSKKELSPLLTKIMATGTGPADMSSPRGRKELRTMTDKELVSVAIDEYISIQRIKIADDRDAEIDVQERKIKAKLESYGINVESLTLKKN